MVRQQFMDLVLSEASLAVGALYVAAWTFFLMIVVAIGARVGDRLSKRDRNLIATIGEDAPADEGKRRQNAAREIH